MALLEQDNDEVGPPSPIALASRLPETSQDEDDENVQLIRAADWGSNIKGKDPIPAPLPHKPTSRERRETLGQMTQRPPRDRPFITKGAFETLTTATISKDSGAWLICDPALWK